ncbi:MAG: hypothetical protein QM793_06695 [Muricomes sp.]
MNRERAKRKADYAEMAESVPLVKAAEEFKRRPYQAADMIKRQGRQMEHKDVLQYLSEKYDIGKGVDAGGQVNPD